MWGRSLRWVGKPWLRSHHMALVVLAQVHMELVADAAVVTRKQQTELAAALADARGAHEAEMQTIHVMEKREAAAVEAVAASIEVTSNERVTECTEAAQEEVGAALEAEAAALHEAFETALQYDMQRAEFHAAVGQEAAVVHEQQQENMALAAALERSEAALATALELQAMYATEQAELEAVLHAGHDAYEEEVASMNERQMAMIEEHAELLVNASYSESHCTELEAELQRQAHAVEHVNGDSASRRSHELKEAPLESSVDSHTAVTTAAAQARLSVGLDVSRRALNGTNSRVEPRAEQQPIRPPFAAAHAAMANGWSAQAELSNKGRMSEEATRVKQSGNDGRGDHPEGSKATNEADTTVASPRAEEYEETLARLWMLEERVTVLANKAHIRAQCAEVVATARKAKAQWFSGEIAAMRWRAEQRCRLAEEAIAHEVAAIHDTPHTGAINASTTAPLPASGTSASHCPAVHLVRDSSVSGHGNVVGVLDDGAVLGEGDASTRRGAAVRRAAAVASKVRGRAEAAAREQLLKEEAALERLRKSAALPADISHQLARKHAVDAKLTALARLRQRDMELATAGQDGVAVPAPLSRMPLESAARLSEMVEKLESRSRRDDERIAALRHRQQAADAAAHGRERQAQAAAKLAEAAAAWQDEHLEAAQVSALQRFATDEALTERLQDRAMKQEYWQTRAMALAASAHVDAVAAAVAAVHAIRREQPAISASSVAAVTGGAQRSNQMSETLRSLALRTAFRRLRSKLAPPAPPSHAKGHEHRLAQHPGEQTESTPSQPQAQPLTPAQIGAAACHGAKEHTRPRQMDWPPLRSLLDVVGAAAARHVVAAVEAATGGRDPGTETGELGASVVVVQSQHVVWAAAHAAAAAYRDLAAQDLVSSGAKSRPRGRRGDRRRRSNRHRRAGGRRGKGSVAAKDEDEDNAATSSGNRRLSGSNNSATSQRAPPDGVTPGHGDSHADGGDSGSDRLAAWCAAVASAHVWMHQRKQRQEQRQRQHQAVESQELSADELQAVGLQAALAALREGRGLTVRGAIAAAGYTCGAIVLGHLPAEGQFSLPSPSTSVGPASAASRPAASRRLAMVPGVVPQAIQYERIRAAVRLVAAQLGATTAVQIQLASAAVVSSAQRVRSLVPRSPLAEAPRSGGSVTLVDPNSHAVSSSGGVDNARALRLARAEQERRPSTGAVHGSPRGHSHQSAAGEVIWAELDCNASTVNSTMINGSSSDDGTSRERDPSADNHGIAPAVGDATVIAAPTAAVAPRAARGKRGAEDSRTKVARLAQMEWLLLEACAPSCCVLRTSKAHSFA